MNFINTTTSSVFNITPTHLSENEEANQVLVQFYAALPNNHPDLKKPQFQGTVAAKAAQIRIWLEESQDVQLLRYLDINSQELTELPPEIRHFQNLKYLRLSHNKLTTLPIEISHLLKLEILSLNHNQIIELPPLDAWPELQILDACHNHLAQFPIPHNTELKKLKMLKLNCNKISLIPQEIRFMAGLTSLDISYNRIAIITPRIDSLSQLEFLDLSHNCIADLPLMGHLHKLNLLNLSANRLTFLSYNFGFLCALAALDLSHNLLQQIPPQIRYLHSLEYLDLNSNEISQVQEKWLTQLQKLQMINFQFNRISSTACNMHSLSKYCAIHLEHNPISDGARKKVVDVHLPPSARGEKNETASNA